LGADQQVHAKSRVDLDYLDLESRSLACPSIVVWKLARPDDSVVIAAASSARSDVVSADDPSTTEVRSASVLWRRPISQSPKARSVRTVPPVRAASAGAAQAP